MAVCTLQCENIKYILSELLYWFSCLPSVCLPTRAAADAQCRGDLLVLLPWQPDPLHQERRTPTPENYPKEKKVKMTLTSLDCAHNLIFAVSFSLVLQKEDIKGDVPRGE